MEGLSVLLVMWGERLMAARREPGKRVVGELDDIDGLGGEERKDILPAVVSRLLIHISCQ